MAFEENTLFPAEISGVATKKRKYKPEVTGEERKRRVMSSITDTMEVIYRDLFDLVNYTPPDEATAPPLRHIEQQPKDISTSFTALTNLLLKDMNDSAHKTVVSELTGAYWTSVHASGFDFQSAPRTGASSRSDAEVVINGNHERAGMLVGRFMETTDPQARYYSAFALAVVWSRYWRLAQECGWKTVAVLLYSSRFRDFARAANLARWSELVKVIKANVMSIQLLGSFNTPWYSAFSEAVLCADEVLTEQERLNYDGHYHYWRVPSDPNSRIAERHNTTFEVGDHTKIGKDGTAFEKDPRIKRGAFDILQPCGVCAKISEECCCNLENWSPSRVELVGTKGKGTGVRALQWGNNDDLYALFGHKNNQEKDSYSTSSNRYGNWTRFVNHSCDANCGIEHVARRGKMLSVYRVTKDIAMFEEVTTDYGSGYFLGRGLKCLCSAEKHLHPKM
ncbi:hypothetical protein L873DRAFT_1394539 [Choiromyces venosus 120613-1]|uniref:SET domain-containing protein n=1 Tax=Choiromyces venosus 120613-1 TaxID=1336337 RepID=A0A3N4J9B8_9PEZI|nr:hypothetical protein L873DRAFT_1394539 [Choiromyces venosus 120613-1]